MIKSKCVICGKEITQRGQPIRIRKTCSHKCSVEYQKQYQKLDKFKQYRKQYQKSDKYKQYRRQYRKLITQEKKSFIEKFTKDKSGELK